MSLKSTHSRSKCGEEKFFDMLGWGIVRSPECDGQYRNIAPEWLFCRFDSGAGAYDINFNIMNARTYMGFRVSDQMDAGNRVNGCYTKIKEDGDVHYLFVAG